MPRLSWILSPVDSLAVVAPSAPGNRPNMLSKVRFSLTMKTTLVIGISVAGAAARPVVEATLACRPREELRLPPRRGAFRGSRGFVTTPRSGPPPRPNRASPRRPRQRAAAPSARRPAVFARPRSRGRNSVSTFPSISGIFSPARYRDGRSDVVQVARETLGGHHVGPGDPENAVHLVEAARKLAVVVEDAGREQLRPIVRTSNRDRRGRGRARPRLRRSVHDLLAFVDHVHHGLSVIGIDERRRSDR